METRNSSMGNCPSCRKCTSSRKSAIPRAYHFCSIQASHPINEGSLWACDNCGYAFRFPCYTQDELNDLYSKQPSNLWTSGGAAIKSDRIDFHEILQLVNSKHNTKTDTGKCRILDIGCYTGDLLKLLKEEGACRQIECYGLEPSSDAAEVAKAMGISIIGSEVECLKSISMEFEIIILNDVYEHLANPVDFLEILSSKLCPGGWLVIVTGAYDSYLFKVTQGHYYYSAMPEHVGFMSVKHSEWLADRLDLNVLYCKRIKHFSKRRISMMLKQLIKSLLYMLFFMKRSPDVINREKISARMPLLHSKGVPNLTNVADHLLLVFGKNDI